MKILGKFTKTQVLIAASVLLVLVGVAWFYFSSTADKPVYDYLQVQRGHLHVTLRESATVGPEHRLNVTPPIPGRIDSVNAVVGQAVKQGQILAWISSTDRAALMDAARAAGGKELEFWQDIYKPAPLVAPLDGNIISIPVVPGEVVVQAQTMFTMSDHLIVQANVDETDLDKIKIGQTTEITFDGFPDAHLTGKVNLIAYDATTVNNVTTYVVNVFLDETPDYIRSGISANVFFVVSDRDNVLQIPTDAITPDGEVLVVKGKNQDPVLQKVQCGLTDGTSTEILSGLNEGDWIARRNLEIKKVKGLFSLLSDGSKKK